MEEKEREKERERGNGRERERERERERVGGIELVPLSLVIEFKLLDYTL